MKHYKCDIYFCSFRLCFLLSPLTNVMAFNFSGGFLFSCFTLLARDSPGKQMGKNGKRWDVKTLFLPLLLPSSFLFLFWRNRVLFLLVCFPCCGPNCTFSSVWKRKAAKATLEEEKWNKLSSFSLFFLSPFRIPFPTTVVRTGAFVSWGIERKKEREGKKGRRRRGIHAIPCTRWRKNKAGETRKSLQQNFLFLLVGRTIWRGNIFPFCLCST